MDKHNAKKIGFTCGAFDLMHAGHHLMFKECKEHCDYLIVGLQTDPSIDRPDTKNKPVQSIEERNIQLESCKYIDETIIYETEADLYDLLKSMQPDIRFIGADHKNKPFTGDDLDVEIFWNTRDHNYSSTNLRERIARAENNK